MGPYQMLLLILMFGAFIAFIFFNISLQKAMREVHPLDRKMGDPGFIWLNLIPLPLWGQVWTLVFALKACEGINKRAKEEIAPVKLAYVFPLCSISAVIIYFLIGSYAGGSFAVLRAMSLISLGFTVASLITWIIFWSQLHQATKKIREMDTPVADLHELLDTEF